MVRKPPIELDLIPFFFISVEHPRDGSGHQEDADPPRRHLPEERHCPEGDHSFPQVQWRRWQTCSGNCGSERNVGSSFNVCHRRG